MIRLLTPDDYLIFRDIRLLSLQTDPLAFISTFDTEKSNSPIYYSERIRYNTKPPIYGYYGQFLDDPSTHHSLKSDWKQNQKFDPRTQSNLIGYVQLAPDYLPKAAHTAYLYELYIRPEYRGQGYGRQLINHATNQAKTEPQLEQIHLRATSRNTHAINLYKKMGFDHIATRPKAFKEPDATYQDEILMYLPLTQPI